MPKKLSAFKVSKIIKMYLQGYSQTAIAHKLKIDQSTVSFQVDKFKARADEVGIEAVGEEYGVMDVIEMLHSLASDLHAGGHSVEEAVAGLGVVSALEELGVEQDGYQAVINAAVKMQKEGFIDSAIELSELEQSTGMDFKELVDEAAKAGRQLEKALIQLEETNGKLDDVKNDLVDMESKKKLTTDDLADYMEQVGMDKNRLKKVEALSLALKKAGIENQQLEEYLQRQQQFNEAGIGIDVFTEILEKAEVTTAKDKGKTLLYMLTEYGSLSQANQALKLNISALEKEASGLEEKAALKGKIQADIDALKVEKAGLEPYVSEFHAQKDKVKGEVSSLSEKQTEIEHEIINLESHKATLTEEIRLLEETTGDLEKRKAEYDELSASLSEVNDRLKRENKRLQIFDSYLGIVKSSEIEELEKFARDLPYFIDSVKAGNHSPKLIRTMLMQQLTGGTLQVLKCDSCRVKFVIDKKPVVTGNYYCPLCGFNFYVKVDKNALEILKEELFALKQPQFIVQQITPDLEQPATKDKGDS